MTSRVVCLAIVALGLAGCTGIAVCESGASCRGPIDPPVNTGGGGGTTGNVQNYQYCPHPDGGLYPCWPDGGEVELDAGASEPADGGGSSADAG